MSHDIHEWQASCKNNHLIIASISPKKFHHAKLIFFVACVIFSGIYNFHLVFYSTNEPGHHPTRTKTKRNTERLTARPRPNFFLVPKM